MKRRSPTKASDVEIGRPQTDDSVLVANILVNIKRYGAHKTSDHVDYPGDLRALGAREEKKPPVQYPKEVIFIWSNLQRAIDYPLLRSIRTWLKSLNEDPGETQHVLKLFGARKTSSLSDVLRFVPRQCALDRVWWDRPLLTRLVFDGECYEARRTVLNGHVLVAVKKVLETGTRSSSSGETRYIASMEALLLSVTRATSTKKSFNEVVRYVQHIWFQPSADVVWWYQKFLKDSKIV